MKSALIIGGSGLLGRGVADELQAAGWKVSLLSRGQRERSRKPDRLRIHLGRPQPCNALGFKPKLTLRNALQETLYIT